MSLFFALPRARMATAILLAATCTLTARAAIAQEKKEATLPIKKVVMFNSGVAFFEHNGKVTDDAKLDLQFNTKDINDLLKSMVLQDLDGGRISTVTYTSRDPITKTLKTFAIDLTSNPSLSQLLAQVRGEKIEIDGPSKITGIILGVEKKNVRVGDKEVVEVEMLNLLTDDGLRSISLENVGRIKLVNEKLDAELRQALQILALGHTTDKKAVSLNFVGKGARNVRVGYIQDAPIWKTSYRLVLDDEAAPFLQGWAIVENTTEEDWKDVNLTLISGRPISFVMDLYQPLYVNRPVVEPELYASLRPQTYGQDLARADQEFRQAANEKAKEMRDGDKLAKQSEGQFDARRANFAGAGAAAAPGKPAERLDLQQGVQSLAQATDVGELFQYSIANPVSLPRQQSAMLPIVNNSVKGEKVSIYNESVQAKHPLNGLKLVNSTELHLMQGPITVFDGGIYAGDAKIEDLAPGTTRLISYALDLDTEVAPESKGSTDELTSVRIVKGTLETFRKYRRTKGYTIKNSGSKAKNVLIEFPIASGWNLVAPAKPDDTTRDRYRFSVKAAPGKPEKLEVIEERTGQQNYALNNLDDNTIGIYLRSTVAVSQKVKDALAEVIKKKQAIAAVVQSRQQLEQKITIIDQEQNRIRQNMAQLQKNSELYNRYVKKFSDQESEIEGYRETIKKLIDDESNLRKAFDAYLIGLELV